MNRVRSIIFIVMILCICVLYDTKVLANHNEDIIVYEVGEAYVDIFTEDDIKLFVANEVKALKATESDKNEITYFTEYKDIVNFVKTEMINRKSEIIFSMPNIENIYSSIKKDVLDENNSTSCKDGDYLLANIVGRSYKIVREENIATYYINVIYTSNAEQEKQIDNMLPTVINSLELEEKSEYEKIKAIHDYVVTHIEYDSEAMEKYYETGEITPTAHSTYSALVKGKAVCQGYASLFFRMCKESGINCRYITGMSGGSHAWNIVQVDNQWYYLDATRADLQGNIQYDYFLKSESKAPFSYYVRDSDYTTEEFESTYPIAEDDYSMPEEPEPEEPEPEEPEPEEPEPEEPEPEEPEPEEPEPEEPEPEEPEIGGHPFSDVPETGWKAEAVKYVYHNGIMNGISGTTLFEPDNTLTRGMFATILYRIAGSPAVTYEARFTDVPDGKWFSNAIIWAADEGIVNGFGDGTYGVSTDITREQVIKMIGVFASKMGNSVSSSNDLSSFEDMDSVSQWARGYVGWAVDNGIISGRPIENGGYRVDPKGTATRAECAKMVSRFIVGKQ